MKLITKKLATMARWAVALLFSVSAIAFAWQGTFFANNTAMAAPHAVIATSNSADQVKKDNKNFVRDAADKVKETANKNANKVENSTDNDAVARKAQRDAARIEERANQDAARTQKAIDKNVNAVERTIDNIKDAFSK